MAPEALRTILLVDDEEGARTLVTMLLEREGYRVFSSATGTEALMRAKLERPSVILLDILMPNMNGHEVLRRLKSDPDTASLPVIILTAKGTDRDIAVSFQLGAVCHVEKPFETRDLLDKIKIALALPLQGGRPAPGGG
ncbi:MAG: response regulator [Candidatus Omnitrophica bacterium]|nr:response regulator [Candidatus Omnitrophota bacterium]